MLRCYILLSTIAILNIHCQSECIQFKDSTSQLFGIDVSKYQTDQSRINWLEVNNHISPKITFAYIRSTMGKDSIDQDFQYNFKNAKINNLKVGIYHFYRPDEDPLEQFEHFRKNNIEIGDLPPVLDFETIGKIGSKSVINGVQKWLKLVEDTYHVKPIIYTTQRFYNIYLLGRFQEYNIWIARQHGITSSPENNQFTQEPMLLDDKCPIIWQYSGTGTINGINPIVDLNISKNKFWAEF